MSAHIHKHTDTYMCMCVCAKGVETWLTICIDHGYVMLPIEWKRWEGQAKVGNGSDCSWSRP